MRHRKHYRSYSEAMKKLNLMASEINRVSGFEENISLIGEQTDVKKKFILKLPNTSKNKPAAEEPATPPPAEDMSATPPAPDAMGATPPAEDMSATPPAPDAMGMGDMGATPPPPPGDDMGIEDMSGEVPPSPEDELGGIGDEESDDEEPQGPTGLKSIQKLTGRLSQKLRSFEKEKGLDSQDIKYVLNSIISALELENLDEDDKDDIISKFDGSDEYGEEGAGELDLSSEEDDFSDIGSASDMGETPPPPSNEPPMVESKVDNLIKSYFKITEEEKPILEEKKKKEFLKKKIQDIETKNEIRNLSESVKQMSKALNLFESNAKFIGKTNKENLVFVKNGKQIKVTPFGQVI